MTRRADPQTARDLVPKGQLPTFTPVPRQAKRFDGWTVERQRRFIEALADTGSVHAACKAVDMSQGGAYSLRRQPGAEEFRAAWEKAVNLGVSRLEDVAMDRALNGVEVPVYSYGELIGTRKSYNDRLLMFMLRNRAPERFGNSVTKGGGALKGMNAVGRMEKRRLKKKWRKQWEEEQAEATAKSHSQVCVQAVRDNIDAKVEAIRAQVDQERAEEWEQFSKDTRAAWKAFETLRNRDFERLEADEAMRRRHYEGPNGNRTRETVNVEPYDWKIKPQPPKRRKTMHGLKDDGWGD